MAGKKKKPKQVRVDFRRNRTQRRRAGDLTRQYRDKDEQDGLVDSASSEQVRPKGDLSRKRTIRVGEDQAPLVDESRWRRGVVTEVHGRLCRVLPDSPDAGPLWECSVRRVLRTRLIDARAGVTVGDQVWFSDQSAHHDGQPCGVIERVDERSTTLSRRDRRQRAHVIVANATQLLIVTSVRQPRIKPHLVDRYLVAAARGDLRPVIVFNKWDLLDTPEPDDEPDDPEALDQGLGMTVPDLAAEFRDLGYTVVETSAVTGLGIEDLRAELADQTTVLSGQSGVGKSSLINALEPELDLVTRTVSTETEKGRHTTTLARLLPLTRTRGRVVDTPGIRSFDLWNVEPGQLEAYFTEFLPLVQHCRFNDCHHVDEQDCAIATAAEEGRVSPRRYASYLKMLSELAR